MELIALAGGCPLNPSFLYKLEVKYSDMLPLFLILYGEDDDTYGGSRYGGGSDAAGYGRTGIV